MKILEDCYSVSETGLVRRDKRVRGNCKPGQNVAHRINKYGYVCYNLSVNGVTRYCTAHRLVAIAFLGDSELPEVNHKDGNKLNNHFSNLEWCSHGHNIRHALKTGLRVNGHGENGTHHKLTEKQVSFIRSKRGLIPQSKLARKFEVSQTLISRLQIGKNWRHSHDILAPDLNQ